jgi:hypothetical protein
MRKMRWGRSGSAKRGGAKVIYFYYDMNTPLYLLLAYAKAQATEMSADETKAFASAYRIPLATLKGWEQGRRHPDATASAYLSVIARMPDAAREALKAA